MSVGQSGRLERTQKLFDEFRKLAGLKPALLQQAETTTSLLAQFIVGRWMEAESPATAEVLEGLKRDVLTELELLHDKYGKNSPDAGLLSFDAALKIAALFDAALAQKEPTNGK